MSQVRNSMETKLGQSFQLLAKQKRTISEVHTHYAKDFAVHCDAYRAVIGFKAIMRE